MFDRSCCLWLVVVNADTVDTEDDDAATTASARKDDGGCFILLLYGWGRGAVNCSEARGSEKREVMSSTWRCNVWREGFRH